MAEEKQRTSKTPEKIVASNYIVNFYQNVQNMNHWYSNYLNINSQYTMKYTIKTVDGKIDEKKTQENFNRMLDEEKKMINDIILELRYSAQTAYIQYKSLTSTLDKTENEKISSGYVKIKEQYLIDGQTFEEYVFEMNKFLLDEVVKNLLETSSEIMQNLYSTVKEE